MRNLYSNLEDFKAVMGLDATDTSDDSIILSRIESASRIIDKEARRKFYVESKTRIYDGHRWKDYLLIDDLLSVSSFKIDLNGLGNTWETTVTEDTDFFLIPYDEFPKTKIEWARLATQPLPAFRRGIQIIGTWGHGDGEREDPVTSLGATVTCNDSDSTLSLLTGNLSSLKTGMTIRLDSEQMIIDSIGESDFTVTRPVNGTSAASHTGATVYAFDYPITVIEVCLALSGRSYLNRRESGVSSEKIGDYSVSFDTKGMDPLSGNKLTTEEEGKIQIYRRYS